MLREVRNSPAFARAEGFQQIADAAERERLHELPTTFHLPPEAIDRLRAAAVSIVLGSAERREALKDEWIEPKR
jgi:NTE family protein